MQSVSASIWTRVAVSITYDDNHYTTGTFLNNCDVISQFKDLFVKIIFTLKWLASCYICIIFQ